VDFISRGDLFARFLGLENVHFNWVMSLFFLKDGRKAYLCSKYFLEGVDERCINSPSHIGNNTNSHHNLPFPQGPRSGLRLADFRAWKMGTLIGSWGVRVNIAKFFWLKELIRKTLAD